MRQYTQNIDWIEDQLSSLSTAEKTRPDGSAEVIHRLELKGPWPTTIHLHGRLDVMRCHKCGTSTRTTSEYLQDPTLSMCSARQQRSDCRVVQGKRAFNAGRMRPNIVLYGEHSRDQEAMGRVCINDIRRKIDAVLVVGTSLNVPGSRRLAIELCRSVRASSRGRATI